MMLKTQFNSILTFIKSEKMVSLPADFEKIVEF